MKCPIDDVDLALSERQGIELDYCPKCRGVWLDRGELDKIIERAGREDAERNGGYDDHERGREDRDRPDRRPPGKRKRGFLGDLFEFGD